MSSIFLDIKVDPHLYPTDEDLFDKLSNSYSFVLHICLPMDIIVGIIITKFEIAKF